MSKLSNQTNSQDPQAVNSRVFVGNLNTFQCSKTDVERMFQRYGRLAGISMHKGYAFVQFTNPFDARNACHGEDGRTILSQVLGDYYASTLFPAVNPQPRAVKRQRLMTSSQARSAGIIANPQNQVVIQSPQQAQQQQIVAANKLTSAANSLLQLQQQQQQQLLLANSAPVVSLCNSVSSPNFVNINNNIENANHQNTSPGQFKIYSNPDILICGNCREMFSELSDLLDHKRSYCKLRFTCKCQDQLPTIINKNLYPSSKLLCVVCKDSFRNPWDLMVHAQAAHMVNIYEIGESDEEDDLNANTKSNKLDKTNGESHNNINGSSCNGTVVHSNENEIEGNIQNEARGDKQSNHSSSATSSLANELLLLETTDNELIINTNGLDNGINEKLSSDLSPNDIMMSSSRSTSPSDKENGMDSPPRACIMRALTIDTNTNPNRTALALSLANANGAAMPTQ
ncbi:CLUMA_CG021232, isoform A [Clunio marinus]|uniref:CLUMA_CG021232, isoform A n=1 Tax=Clunio marinus TaxID=568069 RepID=A0A1J1J7E9_9DIPT|nr:CLUMA_CG021232, isoform A [Clunio marinus]